MAELILDYRPFWAVLISLLASPLIVAFGKKPNLRETCTILSAFLTAGVVYSMLPQVLAGNILECTPITLTPAVSFHFRADAAGMIFACIASGLWVLTSFYAIGYVRALHEEHLTGFFFSFVLCIAAAIGISFSANLLTFIVFFEMLTLATYPLVAHERNDEARASGRRYLVYTLISGQLTLAGSVCVYSIAGTGEFVPGGFLSLEQASSGFLIVTFLLLMAGPIVKAGMMPFHGWLPAAMVAPTPVSALLHAVAVVKAGCFGILRIMGFVFGPELLSQLGVTTPLAIAASFTIIVASTVALTLPNLKQRLAYSTIGQLSYIILGFAINTYLGILGAIFHLVAHAFMKITLFFSAGAIYTKTHQLDLPYLTGLGRQMPLTFAAYTLCSLGIAGLPFVVGFISKWNLLLGALEAGEWAYIIVLVISALLTLGYLLPVSYKAYRGTPVPEMAHIKGEPNKLTLIPLLITATLALMLGIYPDFGAHFYTLCEMTAQGIMGGSFGIGG